MGYENIKKKYFDEYEDLRDGVMGIPFYEDKNVTVSYLFKDEDGLYFEVVNKSKYRIGFTISNIAINRRMKEIDNAYVKIEPKCSGTLLCAVKYNASKANVVSGAIKYYLLDKNTDDLKGGIDSSFTDFKISKNAPIESGT